MAHLYIVIFLLEAYTVLLVSITFFADQMEIFLELIIGASTYNEHTKSYRFLSLLACVVLSIPFLIPKKVNMLQIPGILTCLSSCSIVLLILFMYTEDKIDHKVGLFNDLVNTCYLLEQLKCGKFYKDSL